MPEPRVSQRSPPYSALPIPVLLRRRLLPPSECKIGRIGVAGAALSLSAFTFWRQCLLHRRPYLPHHRIAEKQIDKVRVELGGSPAADDFDALLHRPRSVI